MSSRTALILGGGVGGLVAARKLRKRLDAEPTPEVELRKPGCLWHWAKIAFEKGWLWRWL